MAVGAEVADALRLKGASINLIEMRDGIALGMARNNRFELIERLAEYGVRIFTRCTISNISGNQLEIRAEGNEAETLDIGQYLILATGPRPNLELLPTLEATRIPFVRIGDCNAPGDFLSSVRDACMAALSVDSYAARGELERNAMSATA